jgi:hypothetical protein
MLDSSAPSAEPHSPARHLGLLLIGTEARELADHLADGDTLTAALRVIAPGRRPEIRAAVEAVARDVAAGAPLIAVLSTTASSSSPAPTSPGGRSTATSSSVSSSTTATSPRPSSANSATSKTSSSSPPDSCLDTRHKRNTHKGDRVIIGDSRRLSVTR